MLHGYIMVQDDFEEITIKTFVHDLVESPNHDLTIKSKIFSFVPKNSQVAQGFLKALPIVMGYIPVAFAYGIVAKETGLNLAMTILMSVIVFAGASQFIALSLLANFQSVPTIVITTFIVNLRHLLLSTSIAPQIKSFKLWQKIIFGSELTDESYVLHSTLYKSQKPSAIQNITTSLVAHLSWVLGSILGFTIGSALGDIKVFGLDFSLAAMFIALLVMQIQDKLMVMVALFSGVLAVTLILMGMSSSVVIITSIAGATLGMGVELCKQKSLF